MKKRILCPFCSEKGIYPPLMVLFLAINGITLYNALFHIPWIGYDAIEHIKNISILSSVRLPTPEQSYMFYMPPLSYVPPAVINSFGRLPFFVVLKIAQLLNVFYSLILTYYLLKLCDLIRPGKIFFKTASLFSLGMMPVYYKSFAFIRSEPLAAALGVFIIYKTLLIFVKGKQNLANILSLGIALGLIILTRQTGLSFYPVIFLFGLLIAVKQSAKKTKPLKALIFIFLLAFLIGGWYYIYLSRNYKTAIAYNVEHVEKFSFSNQPGYFYTDLKLDKLFSDPVRPEFRNRFWPIFYSEFWGDYLCYFLVYGRDKTTNKFISGLELLGALEHEPAPAWLVTNRYKINRYLGRVNLSGLLPSAIMLGGFILGIIYMARSVYPVRRFNELPLMLSMLEGVIIMSFLGFFYFLIMYPSLTKGDNIKATYMLHAFPCVAILAGEIIYKIREKSRILAKILLGLLLLSVLHNLSAFFSRYVPW